MWSNNKERKKKWLNKGRTWNREIRLEPFIVEEASTNKGRIILRHGLKIDNYTMLRSISKRKGHRHNNKRTSKENVYQNIQKKPRRIDSMISKCKNGNSMQNDKTCFSNITSIPLSPSNKQIMPENIPVIVENLLFALNPSPDIISRDKINEAMNIPFESESINSYIIQEKTSKINYSPKSDNSVDTPKCSPTYFARSQSNTPMWTHSEETAPEIIKSSPKDKNSNITDLNKNSSLEETINNFSVHEHPIEIETDSPNDSMAEEVSRYFIQPEVESNFLPKNYSSSESTIEKRNEDVIINSNVLHPKDNIIGGSKGKLIITKCIRVRTEDLLSDPTIDYNQCHTHETESLAENSFDNFKPERNSNRPDDILELAYETKDIDSHIATILIDIPHNSIGEILNRIKFNEKEEISHTSLKSENPTTPVTNQNLNYLNNISKAQSKIELVCQPQQNYYLYDPNKKKSCTNLNLLMEGRKEGNFKVTNKSKDGVYFEPFMDNRKRKEISSSKICINDSGKSNKSMVFTQPIKETVNETFSKDKLIENSNFSEKELITHESHSNCQKVSSQISVSSSDLNKSLMYKIDATENIANEQFYDTVNILEQEKPHLGMNSGVDNLSIHDPLLKMYEHILICPFASQSCHNIEDLGKKLRDTQKITDEIIKKAYAAQTRDELELLMRPKEKYYDIKSETGMTDENPLIDQDKMVETMEDVKEYSISSSINNPIGTNVNDSPTTIKKESSLNQLESEYHTALCPDIEDNNSYYLSMCQLPCIKEDNKFNISCCAIKPISKVGSAVLDPIHTTSIEENIIEKASSNLVKQVRISKNNIQANCSSVGNESMSENFKVISEEKEESDVIYNKQTKKVENYRADVLEKNIFNDIFTEACKKDAIDQENKYENYDSTDSENKIHFIALAGLKPTGNSAQERKKTIEEKLIRSLRRINPWNKAKHKSSMHEDKKKKKELD